MSVKGAKREVTAKAQKAQTGGGAGEESRLSLFAVTAPGLEEVAAGELAALGIQGAAEPGGVAWEGTRSDLYASNLWLRTASRVLVRVGEFRARTFPELERYARRLPWDRFLAPGQPVRLRVTCKKSRLYHEGAVAERVAGAIAHVVGAIGAVTVGGKEEEEDDDAASQLFVVRFHYDRCTISADSSGALLHRRGYRQALAKAPLRETLAAAMLLASGWRGEAPLVDPFCGSGTIPIEAALIARNIAPALATGSGEARRYAFERWPDHDRALWTSLLDRAREEIRPAAGIAILGSDRDAGAIAASRANAERAGVLDDIGFEVRPLSALEPPAGAGWLVTNPPYGVRVGEREPLRNLYASLGKVARERLAGWTVALLSADRMLEAQLRLPLEEALRTRNGGIPVRLVVGRVRGGAGAARSAPGTP